VLTPEEWLELLNARLDKRWASWQVYDLYFRGEQSLTFNNAKEREAFGGLFRSPVSNWCPIVVQSSVERLKVQGFRFGGGAADAGAWEIWQANALDGISNMVHTEAVKLGEAYWLVEPGRGNDAPTITGEHPSQVIVACAANNRRVRLAALKKWVEDDGHLYATLYLPERIFKYRSEKTSKATGKVTWLPRPGDEGGDNPLGEVPIIPMPNAPDMIAGGQSDLRDVVPVQAAISKLISDAMVGSEFQAFPQRVITGIEVPETEGEAEQARLKASRSRLWFFEGEDVGIKQFDAADLKAQTGVIQDLVKWMCGQTRTPPHYVLADMANVSGDALVAAETGLTMKVRDKMPALGEGHEDTMRLAFKAMGDTEKAGIVDAETIWRDPESRSFGQLVDGLLKLKEIGVPNKVLQRRAGFSEKEIGEFAELLADQPPTGATTTADQFSPSNA